MLVGDAKVDPGASVYITGRRPAELEAAVAAITATGAKAYGIQDDVAKLEDLDRIYAEIKDRSGHLDVLFANAGGGDMMPLADITEEHFDRVFDANVKGTLFTVQKALGLLKDGSSIILTASTTSVKGEEPAGPPCDPGADRPPRPAVGSG